MRPLPLGALLGAALFAACFVERPSQVFECATSAECDDLPDVRVCRGGLCVVPMCPSDCPDCDEANKICNVECSSADGCGSVQCPTGWSCNINCVGGNACGDIDCLSGSTCNVVCSGTDACETVDCTALQVRPGMRHGRLQHAGLPRRG